MERFWSTLCFAVLIALNSSSARAASRTVQFAGSVINHSTRLRIDAFPDQTLCTVVVANTGNTNQRVDSLIYYVYSSATDKTAMQNGPSAAAIYNGPSGASCGIAAASTCLGTDIAPGGVYVGVAFVDPAAIGGSLLTVCSGQFTVSDSNGAQPGSVVGSGAIAYVAEHGIVGGQFNGALYFGGTHLESSSAANAGLLNVSTEKVWTNSTIPQENLPAWKSTNQMNIFCQQACEQQSAGTPSDIPWCQTLCGSQHQYHIGKKVIGYLEDNSAGAFLSSLIKTADPQWAGGYVMEMIVGPFDSICSGNKAYFDNGGTDFSHVDTIDADGGQVLASPNFPGRGPPERLYCAHTHLKEPPYGYMSPGVNFSINGGMPF